VKSRNVLQRAGPEFQFLQALPETIFKIELTKTSDGYLRFRVVIHIVVGAAPLWQPCRT
jgi:hypothetical protein